MGVCNSFIIANSCYLPSYCGLYSFTNDIFAMSDVSNSHRHEGTPIHDRASSPNGVEQSVPIRYTIG